MSAKQVVRITSPIILYSRLATGAQALNIDAMKVNAYALEGFGSRQGQRGGEWVTPVFPLYPDALHVVLVSVLSVFSYFLDLPVQLQ